MSKSEERFRLKVSQSHNPLSNLKLTGLDKLLIREGFACILSGNRAFESPLPNKPCGILVQRQIFRWPTAVAQDGSESVSTFFYVV